MSELENQSSRCPRSSVTSRQPSASATNRKPARSTERPFFSRFLRSFTSTFGSSTKSWVRKTEMMPTGTLMRKIQCQLALSVIQPPIEGPNTGPQTVTKPNAPNAAPRLSGGKVSASIDCIEGAMPPPPTPCASRAITRKPRLGASPQASEEAVNRITERMK